MRVERIGRRRRLGARGTMLIVGLALAGVAHAETTDPVSDYFADWFDRVDQTQAEQPHWITPLATTTPRLEEEFRYDQYFERLGNGGRLYNFDGGKGLELIPAENVEVILGLPPFQERDVKEPATGFNDWPFLLVKYRLLSANEENGNYILTVFLQGSAPTGVQAFTTNTWQITPTIAGGIGWGDFDVQMTLGESFPTTYQSHTGPGRSLAWNTSFQYHLWNVLWPELEVNDTYWQGGERDGKNQVFLTPGVVVGRMPLGGRAKLILGLGYQIAVAPSQTRGPLTPVYSNNVMLTSRIAF